MNYLLIGAVAFLCSWWWTASSIRVGYKRGFKDGFREACLRGSMPAMLQMRQSRAEEDLDRRAKEASEWPPAPWPEGRSR